MSNTFSTKVTGNMITKQRSHEIGTVWKNEIYNVMKIKAP
jgi:hypothetical protein